MTTTEYFAPVTHSTNCSVCVGIDKQLKEDK